jgi:hypothetical protein
VGDFGQGATYCGYWLSILEKPETQNEFLLSIELMAHSAVREHAGLETQHGVPFKRCLPHTSGER